jgi:hypothetical protein
MAILVTGSSFNVAGVWDLVFGVWKCRGTAGLAMLGWSEKGGKELATSRKHHPSNPRTPARQELISRQLILTILQFGRDAPGTSNPQT